MFIIHTSTGKYRVSVRTYYAGTIRSERKLREAIQKSINFYCNRPGWETYGQALQEKYNANNLIEIASLFGLFSKTERIP